MCGIGVSVVNGILNLNGVDYQVITIANVYPDSPAEAAGVLPGDHIMYIGKGEDKITVHSVGYTQALDRLKGEEGTECAFTVLRRPAGSEEGVPYEEVEISAIRQKFTTRSVTFDHYTVDETVGIIRITGFDNTTRDQFVEAVETLKAEGCQSYVLDLRGNPGGLLSSVEDVLVFFLQEDDIIITTKNASGKEMSDSVTLNKAGKLMCGSGQLTAEDIGKYRDLKISVLVNGYSASAAELFTSNIRDYELGTVVGTTTYGKGCGQTTYSLSRYGYEGALKLTTFYYYPPCGEGYDGIGIVPHVEVELSEEAKEHNINLLPHELDNQLAAAVASMK
jgi:carboxyl-terminal processing protease